MKINFVRDCPTCAIFLDAHPTLDVKNVRNQKMRTNGTWFHTTQKGRILHRYVVKTLLAHSTSAPKISVR